MTVDQTAPNLCDELGSEIQRMKGNLHEKFYSVTQGAQLDSLGEGHTVVVLQEQATDVLPSILVGAV